MPSDQFNVRLPDKLGYGVRVFAATRGDGTKPRDVITAALVACGFKLDGSIDTVRLPDGGTRFIQPIEGGALVADVHPRESAPLTVLEPVEDLRTRGTGCPECGGDLVAYMGSPDVLSCVDCEFKASTNG